VLPPAIADTRVKGRRGTLDRLVIAFATCALDGPGLLGDIKELKDVSEFLRAGGSGLADESSSNGEACT
jgi:hypothetical protein